MNYIKGLIIIVFFYLLALLQTSFLLHIDFLGANFIFIIVIIWNVFEKDKNFMGLLAALSGGFFLDIFSSSPFGLNILILLAIAILIKMVLKKYVRIPIIEKN